MNDPVYPAVAARLRRARVDRKLALDEVAARCGITPSFLGQIERGERKPSLRTCVLIARALEAPIESLFDDAPDRAGSRAWEKRLVALLAGWPEERRALAIDALSFISRRVRRGASERRGG